MSRKWLVLAFVFVAGLLLGGGTVEVNHRLHLAQSQEALRQELRCRAMADKYVNAYSPALGMASLDQVGFSESKNTCFGAFRSLGQIQILTMEKYVLVDLVSGKETQIGTCYFDADPQVSCTEGFGDKLGDRLDLVFKDAILGTTPPPSKEAGVQ
jgi:hypothetical protein